jgi:hypothetical protein
MATKPGEHFQLASLGTGVFDVEVHLQILHRLRAMKDGAVPAAPLQPPRLRDRPDRQISSSRRNRPPSART